MATDLRVRKLVSGLREHPLVESVNLSYYSIDVLFKNGLKEFWAMRPMVRQRQIYQMPRNPGEVESIPIKMEFRVSSLDPRYEKLKSYFIIRVREYRKASFAKLRITIHQLITQLLREGWIDFKYPNDELIKDFQKVKDDRLARFDYGRGLRVYGTYGKGKSYGTRILEHFLPIGRLGRRYLSQAWTEAGTLKEAIETVIKSGKNITRANIVQAITQSRNGRRQSGPALIAPNVYRAIFQKLDIKGTIVDANPRFGSKLLACAAGSLEYYHAQGIDFSEMTEFLGVSDNILTDREYDVALCEPSDLQKWLHKARKVIIHVPTGLKMPKPSKSFPIYAKIGTFSDPDSIFLYARP